MQITRIESIDRIFNVKYLLAFELKSGRSSVVLSWSHPSSNKFDLGWLGVTVAVNLRLLNRDHLPGRWLSLREGHDFLLILPFTHSSQSATRVSQFG